jgi:hypothetical protein
MPSRTFTMANIPPMSIGPNGPAPPSIGMLFGGAE